MALIYLCTMEVIMMLQPQLFNRYVDLSLKLTPNGGQADQSLDICDLGGIRQSCGTLLIFRFTSTRLEVLNCSSINEEATRELGIPLYDDNMLALAPDYFCEFGNVNSYVLNLVVKHKEAIVKLGDLPILALTPKGMVPNIGARYKYKYIAFDSFRPRVRDGGGIRGVDIPSGREDFPGSLVPPAPSVTSSPTSRIPWSNSSATYISSTWYSTRVSPTIPYTLNISDIVNLL